MNSPDYRMQEELEQERQAFEMSILRRMVEKQLLADADYVAASFGLLTEFKKELQ
tara:strand:- start:1405 stop:1569 length:165 start_codon:yes stop_codon:yes gene_type:complete